MLQVINLHKYYYAGDLYFNKRVIKAVDGVSFEIRQGEIWGLIGESGCGKSTLARLLVGLERPTHGRVFLDGVDVHRCCGKNLRHLRKKIQLVFQDAYAAMNSRMSILRILEEPLDNHFELSRKEKINRIRDLLEKVKLEESILEALPVELSGGMRQRVALARALALAPDYMILDEPLASLDVPVQAQILNLLSSLKEQFNLTCLFISHDLSAVQHFCDVIAVMYRGKIVEILWGSDLKKMRHPYTESLIMAMDWQQIPGAICSQELGKNGRPEREDIIQEGCCGFAQVCPEAADDCFRRSPHLEFHNGHAIACWKRRF